MIELMEYLNFMSVERGDYYTNLELGVRCKFLKWYLLIKRGQAVGGTALLWCVLFCVSGPPWVTKVVKSTHISPRYGHIKF